MAGAVLIIEDDRLHRKIYAAVLRAYDYRPIEILDEWTCFTVAARSSAVAIIVDIRLPYLDGREVITRLRGEARTQATPIVAVSAIADMEIDHSCIAAGADRFHAKPVPLLTLMADIDRLTGRHSQSV